MGSYLTDYSDRCKTCRTCIFHPCSVSVKSKSLTRIFLTWNLISTVIFKSLLHLCRSVRRIDQVELLHQELFAFLSGLISDDCYCDCSIADLQCKITKGLSFNFCNWYRRVSNVRLSSVALTLRNPFHSPVDSQTLKDLPYLPQPIAIPLSREVPHIFLQVFPMLIRIPLTSQRLYLTARGRTTNPWTEARDIITERLKLAVQQ